MDHWRAGLSAAAYVAHQATPLSRSSMSIDDYLELVAATLHRIIPGEMVGWNAVDLRTGSITVAVFPRQRWSNAEMAQQLANVMDDHPMARSYSQDLNNTAPRRISDVISRAEFLRTHAYNELFRPIMSADAQLTILTRGATTGQLHCWGINRAGRDFTDGEIETATAFQTTIGALEHMVFAVAADCPAAAQPAARAGISGEHHPTDLGPGPGLTRREMEVLAALSTGLTADAIGRVLRISPTTVRKHVDHIYTKLRCHDRLLVIQKAAALGLLPQT